MDVIKATCGYFLIIFFGVAGVVAYGAYHDKINLNEVMADLPYVWTALTMLICTLVLAGLVMGFESYRRALRGES